jgi:ribosomal protein S18 acetylase RimI-like enzyme
LRATQLTPDDAPEARALLARDPVTNLFLLDKLDKSRFTAHPRDRWIGVRDPTGRLTALAYTARETVGRPADTTVPWGDPAHCPALGARIGQEGGSRMLVGPRAACDAVWAGLGRPTPRRHHDQRLYVADQAPAGPHLPVRRATLGDVAALTEMQAGMLGEDLGIARDDLDLDILAERVEEKVAAGSTWVVREDDRLVFVVSVGFRTAGGAQLGGTYVWPVDRGRGIATRAVRGLVGALLADGLPRVTLHVHEANTPAVRCYVAAGFRPHAPFRLMVL